MPIASWPTACMLSSSRADSYSPLAPEQINRNPGSQQQPSDETFLGVAVDRSSHDESAGGDEEAGSPRMPGNQISNFFIRTLAHTKYKKSRRRKPEENKVRRNHVVQYLFIASGKRNHYCKSALQRYGYNRHLRPARHVRHAPEKQPVFRHCEIHARSSQHALAQKSERGYCDDDGRECGAARSDRNLHRRGSRRSSRSQSY